MTPWMVPLEELSLSQLAAVELPARGRYLITGPPGSGKTLIAVHRAANLMRTTGAIGDGEPCLFLFTNVLKDYVASGLESLGLSRENVTTFDAWCLRYLRANCTPFGEGFPEAYSVADRRRLVHTYRRGEHWLYRFAIVDEGQDLSPEAYEILNSMAEHITVFADPMQQLYGEGMDRWSIRSALRMCHEPIRLPDGFRNSPAVSALAARFIEDEAASWSYPSRAMGNLYDSEKSVLFTAQSHRAEMERLAVVVSKRLAMGQRVGILVPQNDQVVEVANALRLRDVPVEAAQAPSRRLHGLPQADFTGSRPIVVTYHSAKGLTFDSVCLPRLSDQSFYRFQGSLRLRVLFTGITRATRHVYLSRVAGEAFAEKPILEAAVTAGDLLDLTPRERCLWEDEYCGDAIPFFEPVVIPFLTELKEHVQAGGRGAEAWDREEFDFL